MPDAYGNKSVKHRALTVTVKTPSGWPHRLRFLYCPMQSVQIGIVDQEISQAFVVVVVVVVVLVAVRIQLITFSF